MAKLKLRGKDLRAIGYPEGPVISIAMNVMEKNYKFEKEEDVMNLLKAILAAPVEFANDAVLGLIAQQLMPKPDVEGAEISLNKTGIQFNVFGKDYIEEGAMNQMYQAANCRSPWQAPLCRMPTPATDCRSEGYWLRKTRSSLME